MVEELQLAVEGDVAFVQLARPAHGNAFRGDMFDALRRLVLRLSDQPPAFVVVAGEGADFCTGLDLSPGGGFQAMLAPLVENRDAYRVQEMVARLRGILESVARLPCPVIAAIEGRCHGMGLELALMSDLRVASASATFALPGVQDGVLTGLGGLAHLSVLVGAGRTNDIALTGRLVAAPEALSLGLVDRTCPAGAARASALDLVAELRRGSPSARLQTVLAMRAIRQQMVDGLAEQESQCAARTWIVGDWQRSA